MKGTRVQSVVQELRGEKIDIVNWTPDPAEYVVRALAPARVTKIVMDEDEHSMQVIVPDDQLSLAIGKKGQNVRLASRLSGWKLDVCGEVEAEEEARKSRQSLTAIAGIGDVTAELLYQYGFKSAEEVAQSDEAALAEVDGIAAEKISTILVAAREHVEELRRAAEAAAQAAVEAAAQAAAAAAQAAADAAVQAAADAAVQAAADAAAKVAAENASPPAEPANVMADLGADDEGELS
jgi:N utilization substance protein A